MAQQEYKIKLSFLADTEAAKREVNSLGTQLNQIMNKKSPWNTSDLSITKGLEKAKSAALELQAALNSAFNSTTGQMDFDKFNQSLKQGGLNTTLLKNNLSAIGPEGKTAFMSLTKAIISAEVPTKRLSNLVGGFIKTLSNNFKWLISSNLLKGASSAINEAYQYAQALDKSLNDIRIVTGKSTDEMNKFAKAANKAAKELSTTTTEYTNASLIFYQQGLSDKAVKERTNAVIKMANVTGEAAEDVSSYMTAIWNNFDNGTQSLEYYADVITSLGAATASSSEEIAGGLEKFAAIANTVGLSYEYATAALATVVSATRESEETVGTAFKTIFGRLESLSLGETLEDDTTLTKYSAALAAVGVNIKDQNGELKTMDAILDDLGGKWQSLSKDQQVALANTVAGTRQYANFIALMNNYDTVKLNVDLAKKSEGELERQANIYAESWEAARDRVKASAQEVYDSLLNSEDFIKLLGMAEKGISLIARITDGMGGLYGILSAVGAIVLQIGKNAAAEELRKGLTSIKDFVGITQKNAQKIKEDFLQEATLLYGGKENMTKEQELLIDGMSEEFSLQTQILEKKDVLTEREQQILKIQQEKLKLQNEEIRNEQLKADEIENQINAEKNLIIRDQVNNPKGGNTNAVLGLTYENVKNNVNSRYINATQLIRDTTGFLDNFIQGDENLTVETSDEFYQKVENLLKGKPGVVDFREQYQRAREVGDSKSLKEFWSISQDAWKFEQRAKEQAKVSFIGEGKEKIVLSEQQEEALDRALQYEIDYADTQKEINNRQKVHNKDLEKTQEYIDNAGQKTKDWAAITVEVASGIMGVFAAFQALSNLTNVWNNDELSFWEKMLSTVIALGTAATSLVPAFKTLKSLGEKVADSSGFLKKWQKKEGGKSIAEIEKEKAQNSAEEEKTRIENQKNTDKQIAENKQNAQNVVAAINQSGEEIEQAIRNNKGSSNNGNNDNSSIELNNNNNNNKLDIDANDIGENVGDEIGDKAKEKLEQEAKEKLEKEAKEKLEKEAKEKLVKQGTKKVGKKKGTKIIGKVFGGKGSGAGVGMTAGAAGAAAGVTTISAVLIAIGTAVIAGAKKIVDNTLNATKKEFERAQKYYEEAANRHQQAQQKYQTALNNISNYTSGSNDLDTLIRGTDEWKQKLDETNASAIELIKNYGHLIEYKTGADGQIIIESGLEEAKAAAQQQKAAAAAGEYAAEVVRNEVQMKKTRQDFNRKQLMSWENVGIAAGNILAAGTAGAVGGGAIGAGVGGIVGGIAGGIAGTAAYGTLTAPGIWAGAGIGAGIGGTAGAVIGGVAGLATGIAKTVIDGVETETENEALDTVKELYSQNKALFTLEGDALKQELQEAGVTDELLIKSLDKNKESLEHLIETEIKLEETNRALIKQTGLSINQANTNIDFYKDEYQEAIMSAFRYLNPNYSETQAEETKDLRNWFGKGTYAITSKDSDQAKWFLDRGINWLGSNILTENSLWGLGQGELIGQYKTMLEKQNNESGYTITRKWGKVIVKNAQGDTVSEQDISALDDAINQYYEQEMNEGEYKAAKDFVSNINSTLQGSIGLNMANIRDKTLYDQLLTDYLTTLDPTATDKEKQLNLADWTWQEVEKLGQNLNNIQDSNVRNTIQQAINNYEIAIKNKNLDITESWVDSNERRIREGEELQTILSYHGMDTAAFDEYKNSLEGLTDSVKGNEAVLNDVAEVNLRNLQLYDTLYKGLSQYAGSLTTAKVGTLEYAKALSDIAAQLTTSLAIEGLTLDSAFVKNNLPSIRGLFEEDEAVRQESIKNLQFALAEESINSFTATEVVSDAYKDLVNITKNKIDTGNFEVGQTVTASQIGLNIDEWNQRLKDGTANAKDLENLFKLMGINLTVGEDNQIDTNSLSYLGTTDFDTSAYEPVYSKETLSIIDAQKKAYEELGEEIEKINKAKDKAFGADKLALLDQENIKLQEQIDKNRESISLYETERQDSLDDLNKKARELLGDDTFSFEIDEASGNIKQEKIEEFNELLKSKDITYTDDQLNEITSGIEGVENWSESIDNAKDAIEENTETIKENELFSNEYAIELNAKLSDKTLSLIENQLSRLGTGYENAGRRMSLLGNKFEQYADDARGINERWQELQAVGSMDEKTMKQWEQLSNDTLTLESNIRGLVDAYKNELETAINDVNEDLEEQISMIETLNSMTDTFKNIVDVVGREYMPDMDNILAEIDKTKMESSLTILKTTQAQYDAENKILEDMKNNLATARLDADTEAINYWHEQIEAQEKKMVELQAQEASNFAEALQIAADNFTNTVERTINNMEKALASSFGSLEYMQSYYDQQQKEEELYLEDYEKAYELSKLARQVSGSIDEMNNVSAKQKLRDIQQEINDAMKEENKLSEHDLDILQKKYELRLAEIALEDAQNAKTQVRLVQNASGAWSYIYTAEQEKVDQATQDYEDKLYALQKANEEYVDTWSNYILTLEQSFGEGLNKILNTTFSSREAQQKALNEYLQSQLLMLEAYGEMGENIDFDQTIFANQFKDLPEMLAYIQQSFTGTFGIVTDALEEQYTAFDDITSQITDNDLAEYIGNNLDSVAIRSDAALQNVQSTAETLSNTYTDLANTLLDFQIAYADIMKEVMTITDQVGESVRKNLGDATGKVIVNITGGNTGTVHATAYDTGGYTGAWGPEGKLAVLHEKEIVLNKDDTENMLKILDIVNNQINLNALNSVKSFNNSTPSSINNLVRDALEQSVSITAEFPNATNHSEIEQAFENIINMASQYAYRK